MVTESVHSSDQGSARDRRPIALVLTANAISVTGNSLTIIAVPWFVLQTTGSAARAGLVAFCSTLPMVFSALFGGPMVDRMGLRRSSVVSDLVCMAAVSAIPLLRLTVGLHFWELLILVSFSGLFHAPGETAREVLMPPLAERAGTTLSRAASAYEGASRGARMLGTVLSGVLIALTSPVNVLLLDAATFAVSAALIGFGARGVASEGAAHERTTPHRYTSQLREGFAYMRASSAVLALVLLCMTTNAFDQAWSAVLLPLDAKTKLGGSVALGLLSGAMGAGALVGTLIYGVYGHRLPRRMLFVGCFVVTGFPRWAAAALLPGLTPLLIVNAIAGLASGALNPIIGTVFFGLIPERLRSRVMGVSFAGSMAAIPLGGLLGGGLATYFGLHAALLGIGAAYLVATLAPLAVPAFRGMDTGLSAARGEAA